MVVMVVGANGQLGSVCATGLLARGQQVRATVRDPSRAGELAALGADVVAMDVTDAEQRRRAVNGVDVLIASASAVVPRAGDDPDLFDRGLADLVAEAMRAGVQRVILPSVAVTSVDQQVPPIKAKRTMEDAILHGPAQGWVLRLPPLMEVWFALVGSSIPLRGEPFATIGRPSPFLRRFRALTGSSIEGHGVMLVPGRPTNRNAFIAGQDVAAACAEAVERPDVANRVLEIGGPDILTWLDVAGLYEEILHRRVRVVSTPTAVYTAASSALSPVATVPAATMALNRLLSATETPWLPGGGLLDPGTMVTVRAFLQAKAALPAALPEVA